MATTGRISNGSGEGARMTTSDRPATERERAEIARKLRGLIHTTRPVLTAAERAVLIQAEQLLSSLPPVRAEGETHRCSGCGHRWQGLVVESGRTATGAELCGDCWRKAQPVLHGPPVRAEGETTSVKRDAPLGCRIVDGRLVIDIGIETLAFATKESPTLYQRYGYDEEKGEERQDFVKINDPDVWAKEVLRQIVAESEDGSSLMTKLFDDAVERAIDDGAEGIDIPSIGLVDDDDE